MAVMNIMLKNGKTLSAEGAVGQVIRWRTSLSEGATIQLPTKNGTVRVDGRAVGAICCLVGDLSEGDAAAAMMAEPYTHYRSIEGTYQYSEVCHQFEKAEHRLGFTYWRPTSLPEGTYRRIGKDSLLSPEAERKTKEEMEMERLMRPQIYVRIEEEQERMGWKHILGWVIRKLRGVHSV